MEEEKKQERERGKGVKEEQRVGILNYGRTLCINMVSKPDDEYEMKNEKKKK